MKHSSWALCLLAVAAPAAWSQGAAATAATVYRCPGPPILYTDQTLEVLDPQTFASVAVAFHPSAAGFGF